MKLYTYDHCPFCVRAKMISGLKNLNIEVTVLLNDDEATLVNLVGRKIVPVLQKDDGTAMAESLAIVDYLDTHYGEKLLSDNLRAEINDWVSNFHSYINHLVIPRFGLIGLPEYATKGAMEFFTTSKTKLIGDFNENLANSETYIKRAEKDLEKLEPLIVSSSAANGKLSLDDIYLFPLLRNVTVVKGITFPKKVLDYTKEMSKLSKVALYLERAV